MLVFKIVFDQIRQNNYHLLKVWKKTYPKENLLDHQTYDWRPCYFISNQTSFAYDSSGNRLRTVRNSLETRYIYDAAGNLIGEAVDGTTITRYYIHGLGLLSAVTPTDEIYCYHYDAIGSTVAITDISQTVVNAYAYTPFGILVDETEALPQPFKFVGKHGVMAEPDGFYYMRARYYDAVTGRFISEDPLGFGGGDVNLYVYAGNSPLSLIDPHGEFSIRDAVKNPKVTAVLTFGASKLAEYAATKMEPSKLRATVYATSGALSFASAYTAAIVSVGSYAVAVTTVKSGVGAVAGFAVGTAAFGFATYDINMAQKYFKKAYGDVTHSFKKNKP